MTLFLGYLFLWLMLLGGNALADFLTDNETIQDAQPTLSLVGKGLVHATVTALIISMFVHWYPFLTILMLGIFVYEVAVHYFVERVRNLFNLSPLFDQLQHAFFKLVFILLIALTGGIIVV